MKDNKSYKKLSKFELILTLLTKSQRDDIFALASQMAYYLILSFFPFLMFLSNYNYRSFISSFSIFVFLGMIIFIIHINFIK